MSTGACNRRCIGHVREDGGCDEDIDARHGRFGEIKAAGDRRSALDRLWFGWPFHPDCVCGE
jgi:hypothetical protein